MSNHASIRSKSLSKARRYIRLTLIYTQIIQRKSQ